MSILTQTIEIYEDGNPLESKFVKVPVKPGCKILSHEPYAIEAMKMYDAYCSPEIMGNISSYEEGAFKTVREGVVSSYNADKDTATINLSPKHSVAVTINKNEQVEVGNKIDVVVSRHKGKISADASSKSAQIERLKQELIKQIQTPTSAYKGVIKSIVYNAANTFNGFIVDVTGFKCFMPGTESDVVPLNDYTTMVGKELYVMPVAESKDSIVVSHKEYLNTLKPVTFERLNNLEKGTLVEGEISSVKHFGVFILIDSCVPTLLSVSEMDEDTENKFKSNTLKIGDKISFYIDNITDDRITVTQTVDKSEGWDKLKKTVSKSDNYILKGVVKNIFDNGVVIISEEFNGITFFLSSKVVSLEGLEIGKDVELPVENVDTVKKTVRLKIVTE